MPLILDSNIQEDTLKLLGKKQEWVYDILRRKNITLEEVFYAFYKDRNIFIIKKSDLG